MAKNWKILDKNNSSGLFCKRRYLFLFVVVGQSGKGSKIAKRIIGLPAWNTIRELLVLDNRFKLLSRSNVTPTFIFSLYFPPKFQSTFSKILVQQRWLLNSAMPRIVELLICQILQIQLLKEQLKSNVQDLFATDCCPIHLKLLGRGT